MATDDAAPKLDDESHERVHGVKNFFGTRLGDPTIQKFGWI